MATRNDTGAPLSALLLGSSPGGPTIDLLLRHLFERSPEFILLILSPVAILPATSVFAGAVLAFVAVPMIAHRRHVFIPRFLGSKKIAADRIERTLGKLSPVLRHYGIYARFHPNSPANSHTRWAGALVLVLALALLVPLPLSNILPGAAVGIVGLASLAGSIRYLLLASFLTAVSVLFVFLEALSAFHLAALAV